MFTGFCGVISCFARFLVMLSGLFSGLTLGLMGLDVTWQELDSHKDEEGHMIWGQLSKQTDKSSFPSKGSRKLTGRK